ncbi:hypothetical protein [Spiroplasma floricola]|uniref:Transmembrane protein n=1 Tax=Spiroplasma floricola 23-6 TaxID=1336749 RepID=A0A2K8SE65_9MOLU|nr:hypothetical protein [Spiroplasma floricola]AUB31722.1 hypothetical protein SFLOR_v1c06740 [Spiroplasma floricola 23-6]
MSKLKSFLNKESLFSFTKQLKIFLSTILIVSALLIFYSVINNKKKLENPVPLENNGLSNISLKLENEFNNYNKKMDNISYFKSKDSFEDKINIEDVILSNIIYLNNKIEINFKELNKLNLTKSLIELLESKDFEKEILKSINSNEILIINNKLIFNENYMINNSQIPYWTIDFTSDFWLVSKWYWFGYKRFEMSQYGREILVNIGADVLLKAAKEVLSSAGSVLTVETILVNAAITGAAAIASILWWVLLGIGLILLLNAILYHFTIESFKNYSGGAYIGILDVIIVNWNQM